MRSDRSLLPRALGRRRARRREAIPIGSAAGRSGADPPLSADPFRLGRPAVPLPAYLLGLRGRSDPRPWTLGGRLDGGGAHLSLPSLGRDGFRSAAGRLSGRGILETPLALWAMAAPLRMN